MGFYDHLHMQVIQHGIVNSNHILYYLQLKMIVDRSKYVLFKIESCGSFFKDFCLPATLYIPDHLNSFNRFVSTN